MRKRGPKPPIHLEGKIFLKTNCIYSRQQHTSWRANAIRQHGFLFVLFSRSICARCPPSFARPTPHHGILQNIAGQGYPHYPTDPAGATARFTIYGTSGAGIKGNTYTDHARPFFSIFIDRPSGPHTSSGQATALARRCANPYRCGRRPSISGS